MKMTRKQRTIAAAVMATIIVAAIICGVIRNSQSAPAAPADDVIVDVVNPCTTPSIAPAVPAAPSIAAPAPATDIGDPSVVVVGPDCGTDYYTPAIVEETVTLPVSTSPDFVDDCDIVDEVSDAPVAPSTEEEWEAIYGYDYSSRNDDTPEVPYEQYSSEESLEEVVMDEPSEVAPLAVEECEDTPDAAPEEIVAEESFSYEEDDSDDSATFEEAALQEDAPDEQPAEAPAAEAVEDTPDAAPAPEAAPVEAPAAEAAPAVDATPVVDTTPAVETAPAVEAAPAVDTVVEAAPAADVAVDAVAW